MVQGKCRVHYVRVENTNTYRMQSTKVKQSDSLHLSLDYFYAPQKYTFFNPLLSHVRDCSSDLHLPILFSDHWPVKKNIDDFAFEILSKTHKDKNTINQFKTTTAKQTRGLTIKKRKRDRWLVRSLFGSQVSLKITCRVFIIYFTYFDRAWFF